MHYFINRIDEELIEYLRNKKGKVHSVFKRSFNIMFDRIININMNGDYTDSFGMNMDNQSFIIDKGDVVYCGDNTIIIKDKNIIFDYSYAEKVDLHIRKIEKKEIEKLQKNLKGFISAIESNTDLDINFIAKITGIYEFYKFLKFLIGNGKGLTPSGDDFIMGYILGLNILGIKHMANEQLRILMNKTNIISRTKIMDIINFKSNSIIKDIIYSLRSDEDINIYKNIYKITSYGSTSGYDFLLGLSCSLNNNYNSNIN